jgi:hypothetical protein
MGTKGSKPLLLKTLNPRGAEKEPHRAAREVGEGVCPAVAHGYESQVRQGVLVEELPDERLQVERDHSSPGGPHI